LERLLIFLPKQERLLIFNLKEASPERSAGNQDGQMSQPVDHESMRVTELNHDGLEVFNHFGCFHLF